LRGQRYLARTAEDPGSMTSSKVAQGQQAAGHPNATVEVCDELRRTIVVVAELIIPVPLVSG